MAENSNMKFAVPVLWQGEWDGGSCQGRVVGFCRADNTLAVSGTEHIAQFDLERINQLVILNAKSVSGRFIAPEKFQLASEQVAIDLLSRIRKQQHIEICAKEDVESSDKFTGFSDFHFIPEALPTLNLSDLDTSQTFLGRKFSLPILITGMTGGVDEGSRINENLAAAATHHNIPMGVGSQRIALENPGLASIFTVKKNFPKLFLIGNLGYAQLRTEDPVALACRAVDMIDADALAIHLNFIQEAIQLEGDLPFGHGLEAIEKICRAVSVPVIVKEVGCGISPNTARKLISAGVSAIDVGGRGGTSWARIEGMRSINPRTQRLGELFGDWGIPTAYSVRSCAKASPGFEFVATGGIRNGLVVAKALGLGATMVGVGLPLFKAALISSEAVIEVLDQMKSEFITTMLAVDASCPSKLFDKVHYGLPLSPQSESGFGGPHG